MRFATARARGSEAASRSRTRRLPCTLAATALVAVTAAGCGGSSKPTITKAEYVKKANAICTHGNAAQQAAAASLGQHPSHAQINALVSGTFIPNIQAQIDAVRALGAPSGEEATVSHMLDVAQEDLDKAKSNPSVFAQENAHPFANFAAIAHPYGLTECARNE